MHTKPLAAAALLGTTALTPTPARAEPVSAFISGVAATFGLGVTAPAIGSAAYSAFMAGITVGSFVSTSWIGQTLLSIGLSAVSSALAARANVSSANERLVNFGSASAPMEWAFGIVRKGGPYLMTTYISDRRYYAVALAGHPIEGADAWYLDQRPVEIDAENDGVVITSPYYIAGARTSVYLRLYDGGSAQAADARFVANVPEWTSNHDVAGLAYVAVEARRVGDGAFHKVYGNSPATGPMVTAVLRAANTIYDPRTDTVGWTRNAALVWAWLTVNWLGGTVNWTHVAAQADRCDEEVLDRDGNPRPRWVLSGSFADNVGYEEVRANVIAACDGYMFERPDGSLGLTVGGYTEPTITLTDDDFFSLSIQVRDWGPNPPTEYVAKYVNPNRDWTEAPSGTWVADPDAAVSRRDIPLPFVDSHNQALRCLKRIARASRPEYTLTGDLGLIGYELIEHRFVRIRALGLDFVAEIGRLMRGESLRQIRMEAVSVTAADFEFDAATEEPAPPPSNSMETDDTVPVPAEITGTARTGLQILWEWPQQRDDLRQEIQLRRTGDTVWPGGVILSEGATEYVSTGHVEGVSYRARIRNITPANRAGDWLVSGDVVAVSSLVAPSPPSNLQLTLETASWVDVSVRMPNDPDAVAVRIYRHDGGGSPAIGDATLVQTLYGSANATLTWLDDSLPAGAHSYWAVAINASATQSTAIGPETITTS